MEYRVLGPLEVRGEDGPLPLGGETQRAVLALLLLNANRVVPRERLIDELWGDSPPETAVATVQVYVSRLRKLLPPDALLTRSPGYLLAVGPDELDVERFARLVAEARDGDSASAAERLREALALWRGPAFAELGQPFAQLERGRLEDLRLAALEERIDADLALGRHADVIGEVETLIAEQPHRERLRRQLMLALYRSGRQAEALTAYRDARAALDELGLEPSAALRQLERQLLTQDRSLDLARDRVLTSDAIPLPGLLVPSSPFPFVGREDELAALRALIERARAGEGGSALITGEAGAGKTRLVRELAQSAAAAGVLVLYGASDAAVRTAYLPLREWLEFLLLVCDPAVLAETLGDGVLARLVPELEALTGPAPEPGDAEADRYRLQSAATRLLAGLSRVQPLLVVVDDLQWSDGETLQFLRRLVRTAPEARLAVVVAFRDPGEKIGPELADALADIARLDSVKRLPLGNLDAEEVSDFIRAFTGAEAVGDLAARIGELSDGTPLLLCELSRELRESGGFEIADERVRLSRPLAELAGPTRLQDVVRQRVLRLNAPTRELLEIAAVAGPRFELRVVEDASAARAETIAAFVDEATRSGIVEELPEPIAACRFTHELVRRAIYDRLTGIHRAELHLRAGEAIERVHGDDPSRVVSELAHHFTLATRVAGVERAVAYNLRAGYAAFAEAASYEAVERLSTALELGISDAAEQARVQLDLAFLMSETGRPVEAMAMLEAGRDSATDVEKRRLAEHVLMRRQTISMMADPEVVPAEHQALLEHQIATFAELGDARGLAIAERVLAMALRREGRMAECCAVCERALAHTAAGGRIARRQVVGTLAYGLCDGPAPVSAAIGRCEELLELVRADRGIEGAVVNRALAALHAMAGHSEQALELEQTSSAVLDAADNAVYALVYRMMAAEALELAGDPAGAERELVAKWEELQARSVRPFDARAMHAAYHLALIYCDERRWPDAERCVEFGGEVPVPDHFLHEAVLGQAARARVAAHGGALDTALTLALSGVELAMRGDMVNVTARTLEALAEVRRRRGEQGEADAAVAHALDLYEAKGNVAAAERLRYRAWS